MISSFGDSENNSDVPLPKSYYANITDNGEVDKYVMMVEPELKKQGINLNDSALIANILKILDTFAETQNFDKTLFFHILDFANLNREKPVKLLDFFRSFFKVYEAMKINRDKFANENNTLTQRIHALESKRATQQKEEKVKEDGTTPNSQIKVHFINAQAIDPSAVLTASKVKFQIGSDQEELYLNAIDTKISFQMRSMQMAELPFQVWLLTGKEEVLLENINVKEMLDNSIERSYAKKNIRIDVSFFWINSLVTFYNKQSAKIESQISENKESLAVLNKSILYIEGVLKRIFQGIPNNKLGGEKAGTVGKEIDITNKIEQMILKATGTEIIMWDHIVYLLTKLLIPLLLLEFLGRFDILTLFFVTCIIGVEIKLLKNSLLYKLLILLLVSIAVDFFWIFTYIRNWSIDLDFEGSKGTSMRKLCIVTSIFLLIIKLLLSFSLWKMSLQSKLLIINQTSQIQPRLSLGGVKGGLFGNDLLSPTLKQPARPRLLKNTTQFPLYSIRNFDDIEQP